MKHILLFLLLLTSSCMSVEKAKQILDKHPQEAAEYCATKFVNKSTDSTEVVVTTGNTDELKKRLLEAKKANDSMKARLAALPVKEECKGEVAARDSVISNLSGRIDSLLALSYRLTPDVERKTITRYIENTAQVIALQGKLLATEAQLQKEKDERATAQKKATNRGMGLIGLLLVGALVIVMPLVKKFV